MKIENLANFVRGWFIGDFKPTLHETTSFEVAVKRYSSGETEAAHFHAIATEITVIVSGRVLMNGCEYKADDIIVMEPGESTDFRVIEDCIAAVIKVPSVRNDKFPASPC